MIKIYIFTYNKTNFLIWKLLNQFDYNFSFWYNEFNKNKKEIKNVGEIILLVVLIVLLVAMFVMSYIKRKKYNQGLSSMREELKKGDKVMTDSGIVGEVVDSYTEEEYKYFVLKSGKGDKVGYFSVHANAIYYVFGKDETKTQLTQTKVVDNKEEKKVENVVAEEMLNQKPTQTQTNKPKTSKSNSKKKSK